MIYKQISYNVSPISCRTIEYIVIHDTGNKNKGANAEMHYKYFNSGDRKASADFFVDDTQIIQTNDYTKKYTWHVGDGKGKYGITNKNSIGIEMCVNPDGDYSKVVRSTIELVKELKKKYPAAKVVRHYDASRKHCPASLAYNNWQGWAEFLRMLEPKELTDEEVIKTLSGIAYQSPDYWQNAFKTGEFNPEYVKQAFRNMASYIKKG